jgi:hypothetical protein
MKPRQTIRERFAQQALAHKRRMVANGELLPEADFKRRLGVSQKRFARLLEEGCVFGIDVDGTIYFPTLLADGRMNRKRLQSICRTLVPAPPGSRLHFLSSSRGSLGERSPLQMLDDNDDFKRLQQAAAAWAAEWSRTAVTMYEGEHETEPKDVEPLYTAAAEIDLRRPLWERASEALHVHGYEWPRGPYPEPRAFTIFVERQTAGSSVSVSEACIQVSVNDNFFRVRVRHCVETVHKPQATFAAKSKTVVDAAKKVIAHFRKQ